MKEQLLNGICPHCGGEDFVQLRLDNHSEFISVEEECQDCLSIFEIEYGFTTIRVEYDGRKAK